MASGLNCLCKYTIDRKFVETWAGKHVNFLPSWRATTRVGSSGKQHDDRTTAGCCNVRGAGVVPNGEKRSVGKIGQASETGAADEVDGIGAGCADLGREQLLAAGANNDRKNGASLE